MTHEIFLPIQQLEGEFDDLIDFMVMNYHSTRYNTPSNIPNYGPMTAEEQAEFDAYEGIGQVVCSTGLSTHADHRREGVKRVIHYGNPNFCNGLPRRKRSMAILQQLSSTRLAIA
jgi:hypothetical protein